MKGKKAQIFALGGVLLTGLALRLYGIRQDLPYHYFIDESENIYNALKYGTLDLNPHDFVNPPFFQYCLFAFFGVYYVAGKLTGRFASPDDFILEYLEEPTAFFMIARLFVAIVGTLGIYFAYRLGSELSGGKLGLLAATGFAVFPLHVGMSHYATVDVPMTTLFTAALWLVVRYRRTGTGTRSAWLWACLLGGLAAGTKYTGGIVLVGILAAVAVEGRKPPRSWARIFRSMTASVAAFGAAFVAVNPFSVLDFRSFVAGIHRQWIVTREGWKGWEDPVNGYLVQLQNLVFEGGLTLVLLALAGALLYALKGGTSERILVLMAALFYAIIGNSQLTYGRFLLPLVPLVSVLAAVPIVKIMHARRHIMAAVLVLPFTLEPLLRSLASLPQIAAVETRTLAARWIRENVPPGSRILMEVKGPPIRRNVASLEALQHAKLAEDRESYGYREASEWFFELQRESAARAGERTYFITEIYHPVAYREDEEGYNEEWMTAAKMSSVLEGFESKYDLILVFDYQAAHYLDEQVPEKYAFMREFYGTLAEATPVQQFVPEYGQIKGPWIRIYEMNRGG